VAENNSLKLGSNRQFYSQVVGVELPIEKLLHIAEATTAFGTGLLQHCGLAVCWRSMLAAKRLCLKLTAADVIDVFS